MGNSMLTFPTFPLQKNGCVEVIAKSEGSSFLIPFLKDAPSKFTSLQLEIKNTKEIKKLKDIYLHSVGGVGQHVVYFGTGFLTL